MINNGNSRTGGQNVLRSLTVTISKVNEKVKANRQAKGEVKDCFSNFTRKLILLGGDMYIHIGMH